MRTSIAAAAAIAASAALSGCNQHENLGPMVSRGFQVGTFDQVEAAGPFDLTIHTGAAPSVGASATAGAKTGAASVKLTTTAAGSQIWAAGHDWTHAAAQTALPGQSLVEQNLDTRVGDTYWVEQSAAIPTAGPVTFGSSAPTTDRWELAAVEVRAAG